MACDSALVVMSDECFLQTNGLICNSRSDVCVDGAGILLRAQNSNDIPEKFTFDEFPVFRDFKDEEVRMIFDEKVIRF